MATTQNVIKERAYTLTADEKNVLGNQLLGLLNDEDELAREKKAAVADFKSQEEALANRIIRLREKASTGIELRKYKCSVIRNAQTKTVDTVYAEDYGKDMMAGDIYEQRPWEPEDWNAHALESQIPLDFDSAGNPNAPDENDLRGQADLTANGPVEPTRNEQGQVIAGHETDAYNMANPESPYQHLSEQIHFAPQVTSVQAADAGADQTDAADVDRSDKGIVIGTIGLPNMPTGAFGPQDDDEPTDEDEPGDEPTPPAPKRPAKRIK